MASHERLLKERLRGLACALFVLVLCAGAEIFAQQRSANPPSGKLYLVAATLAMDRQPSGYPVTVYEVANGTLKTVREVIPPYPDYDAAEATGAPTAIGRVLASENALYFIHLSPDGSSPNSISIIHFENPAKTDSVQIETHAVFPVIGIMDINTALTVVSRSSEDEVLIPISVLQPGQDPLQASVSLTSILVTPQQTKACPTRMHGTITRSSLAVKSAGQTSS